MVARSDTECAGVRDISNCESKMWEIEGGKKTTNEEISFKKFRLQLKTRQFVVITFQIIVAERKGLG